MRLIDRIALNRAIQMLLDFILTIIKIFDKSTPEHKPDGPVNPKPSPKRRPLKDLIDNIVPWREQK
jgi:hypothetical protein